MPDSVHLDPDDFFDPFDERPSDRVHLAPKQPILQHEAAAQDSMGQRVQPAAEAPRPLTPPSPPDKSAYHCKRRFIGGGECIMDGGTAGEPDDAHTRADSWFLVGTLPI